MANARRIAASALGISAGLAGIEHGVFEVLRGNVRPEGVVIASIGAPCVPERMWNACEPAMTIIPNYLATGILSIIVSVLVTGWAAGFIQRKGGGLVSILLSIALLLVGGGFFPPLIGIVGGVIALKIHSPLAWWTALGSSAGVRVLGSLWPWVLIVYLVWVFGQWIIGHYLNDWLMRNGFLIFIFVLGPLVLSVLAALAHDARRGQKR
jgi:hypothetical protein